jgi:hypothetical protein
MSDSAQNPDSFVPVVVGVTIHGAAVLVDWDPVDHAAGYEVEVLDADGHALSPQPNMEPGGDGSSMVLTGPGIVDGARLGVRVRSVSAYSAAMPVAVSVLYPPAAPTLALEGAELSARWAAVAGAGAYEVEVLEADGLPLHPQPALRLDGAGAAIDAAGLQNGASYGVRVRASAGISTSAWSEAATLRIARVPPPAIVDALYHDRRIDFSWSPIPGATRYLVQVLDAGGQRLAPQPNVTGFNHTAAVSGVGIASGAMVQLQVGVEVAGQGSAWSDPLPLDLLDLAAPQGVEVTAGRDVVEARWQPVPGATGYRLQVLDDAGQPVPDVAEADVDDTDAQVQAPSMRPGATYQVRVVATAPHAEGPPSEAVPFTRTVLPTPEGLAVVYRAADRRAAVSWQPVEGAAAYVVRLLLDGEPVDGQPDLETTTTSATLPAVLAPGTAYHVQVRGARRDADGEWASANFVAVELPAPTGLSLRGGPAGVDAAWAPVPGATGYELRVLDADAELLSPAPEVAVDGTTARIAGPAIAADGSLEVRVRATAPGAAGPFGEPAILRPGATPASPAGVQAVYHAATRTVKVSWAPVAGSGDYRVRMADSAGQPVGSPVSSAETRVVLDGSRLGTGDEYAVQVSAATADGEGPPSAPARFTVHEVGAPTGVRADSGADGVRVRWQAVDSAAEYEVRLYDGEGMPLSPPPAVPVHGTSALVPRGALVGRSYVEVRVRAAAEGTVGAWSNPLGVALLTSAPSPNGGPAATSDDEQEPLAATASAEAPEAPRATLADASASTPSSVGLDQTQETVSADAPSAAPSSDTGTSVETLGEPVAETEPIQPEATYVASSMDGESSAVPTAAEPETPAPDLTPEPSPVPGVQIPTESPPPAPAVPAQEPGEAAESVEAVG